MPLLVDCYNLLHATMPPQLAGLEEVGLCRLLAHTRWARGRIVVVCDGSVKPHGPAQSPVEQVELVYSGPRRSADDVMIDMINADSAPKGLTVVTSDRQIQKAARRRKCRVMPSDKFVKVLASTRNTVIGPATPRRPAADKPPTSPLNDQEVNDWLQRFGFDPEQSEDKDDTNNPW